MTSASQSVVSGQSYIIDEINGHPPATLGEFIGMVQLLLVRNGDRIDVAGECSRHSELVRFYQKDAAIQSRDVRVWTISQRSNSEFVAESCAAF